MALARRLNELAVANQDGLLNDDEYRMLRQSVFEQYSSTATVPIESPIVPVSRQSALNAFAGYKRKKELSPPAIAPKSPPPPNPRLPANPPNTTTRVKPPLALGVTNLIKRATSRRTPTRPDDIPASEHSRRPPGPTLPVIEPSKRPSGIPRLLGKRLPAIITNHIQPTSHSSPHRSAPNPKTPQVTLDDHSTSPIGPLRPAKRILPSTDSSLFSLHDVFDESNLGSAQEIRLAISRTEDEARRLVDAFNKLEANTISRIQRQSAPRTPVSTPATIDVLLEGREWRQHRLVHSPSSPVELNRPFNNAHTSNADTASITSGTSHAHSLSLSKSISSLPKIPTPATSPVSKHFRTPSFSLLRKNSVSSVSSRSTTGMLSVSNSSHLSRSTSHLSLINALETTTIPLDPNVENDSELSDIRTRKDELVGRYNARLEFLHAKLKGAELHEKLLRK